MGSTSTESTRDAAQRPALLNYVREGRCVLFVGAGLSRAAGFPDWRELMASVVGETVQRAGAVSARDELEALLTAGRYPELADQCREILGRARFTAALRAQLATPAAPPEATHRAIVRTPYAALVTTNFDTLLEDAYARWSDEGVPKAPTGARLGRHGTLLLDRAFFILKAHGTIHDDASLVFTSEDYRQITHANPAFQSMMAAILLTHAVVFVGYSLSDPNFRLLFENQLTVFGTQAPPRYAVMEGVGRLEGQILRRTAGIEVIAYPRGEHEHVATFLGTLADATQPAAPRSGAGVAVLRARTPQTALRLSLRPRGPMLDVEWFETTTDDLAGNGVPLERRWSASTTTLPWASLLQPFQGPSVERVREVGALLGEPLERLGVPFLAAGGPRLVMLDVPEEFAALPWEWLHVQARPLCVQAPTCRMVPGVDEASRGRPFFHAPLRVLLVGDALADSARFHHPLPGTREEAGAIQQLFGQASARHSVRVLVGRQASYERVLREMGEGYDIVHLTGVAYVDDDGESVVPLHDGHVRASELAALLIRKPPGLLFVNEDCSGFVPAFEASSPLGVVPGEAFGDLYRRMQRARPGLERVVARAGVGTFIGCMAPAVESVARDIAVAFYTHLLAGQPMAQALFLARASRAEADEHTALLFAMAGYPDVIVTEAGPRAARRPATTRRRSRP